MSVQLHNAYTIYSISTIHYIIVACLLFTIGFAGVVFNRRNLIATLISIEVMLLSVNLLFATFSSATNDPGGQIFSLFILAVAAAETAIGLSIFIVYFRKRETIDIKDAKNMKG